MVRDMNKQEDKWYDMFFDTFSIRRIEIVFMLSLAIPLGFMLGALTSSDSVEKTHREFIELGCGQYNSVTGAFEYINRNNQ